MSEQQPQAPSKSDRLAMIVRGLKQRKVYLVDQGQRVHALYPATKMDPAVFEAITVPVALPVALLLFGLGCAMVAEVPDEPVQENAP